MLASVLAIIQGILQAIPILSKYFKPKTEIEKQQAEDQAVDDEIQRIRDEGRP